MYVHLLSEKYDRDLNDIFVIQDEIALAVTEKLKVTLLVYDLKQITKPHTLNTEAYQLSDWRRSPDHKCSKPKFE